MRMNIREEVVEMLEKYTGMPPRSISINHHINKDLGLDSLDFVEFTMNCEQTFNILPNWEDEKIHTVGDLINIIKFHSLAYKKLA
jgi:acyl carrier protein